MAEATPGERLFMRFRNLLPADVRAQAWWWCDLPEPLKGAWEKLALADAPEVERERDEAREALRELQGDVERVLKAPGDLMAALRLSLTAVRSGDIVKGVE